MNRSRSAVLVVILALGAALEPGAEASELGVTRAAPAVAVPGEAATTPPVVTIAAPPRVATLADDPPSGEGTPQPTAAEWRATPRVMLSREHPDCKAQRAREWLRITCRVSSLAAMELLAGPREGVSFDRRSSGEEPMLVLPLRRGDRRVIQIVRVSSMSKYTVDYDAAFVVTEDWLEGAAAPTVVVD